jgi:RNA recognition motif-containing protein
MQKKIYFGGLPWETDRIGLLNYVKAVLEGNNVVASYELPFVSSPLINPNSSLRVTDVFVALDRKTRKSRGFGFVTMEFSEDADAMLNKIIDMMQGKIMIGIRGPRELIVKEADPRDEEDMQPRSREPRNEDEEKDQAPAMGLNW